MKLTKIQRFRFSQEMTDKLDSLPNYGLNKSKFVRDAVQEKLNRTQLSKPKKQYCPF